MIRALCIILMILAVALMVLGCSSKEITRQNVVGTYIANYDKDEVATDSITINDDETYTHYFKSAKEDRSFTNTGTWGFEYSDGTPRVYFQNFIMGYSSYTVHFGGEEELKRPSIWSPPVEDGGEKFVIDYDLGLHYEKQG